MIKDRSAMKTPATTERAKGTASLAMAPAVASAFMTLPVKNGAAQTQSVLMSAEDVAQ